MMRFPVPLFDGKKDSWYFIARLTNKEDYSDKEMGDRLLAVFQGLSGYFFFTNDETTKNSNLNRAIPYGDIESVWTYIYYSYSST